MSSRRSPASFGALVRDWRTARRKTQWTLAADAGVSVRHLSFLESGRSHPSREMVLTLGRALELPDADRNILLIRAGYAVEPPAAAAPAERATLTRWLRFIIDRQDPCPAIVIDARWNIVMQNTAAQRVFACFLPPSNASSQRTPNAMRTVFHPCGLRRSIANWHEIAASLMHTLHRDIAASGDLALSALRDELLAYPDVPAAWGGLRAHESTAPLLAMTLRSASTTVSFFAAITSLVTAGDRTPAGLRIESFYPATEDDERQVHDLLS